MCLFNKLFMVLGNGGSPINKTDTVPALKNLTVWEGRQTPSCDLHTFTHLSQAFVLYLHKHQNREYVFSK